MTQTTSPSILKSLRTLVPRRACSLYEALLVAERQAGRLVEFVAAIDPGSDGIDLPHIQGLPRIRVVFEPLPISGMSHWNGHEWVIAIAGGDSLPRQRFTLLHEFKHILDHGQIHLLYTGDNRHSAAEQAERAADYFAGCALVPRAALKRAWGNGMQRVPQLAEHFGVSEAAMRVRLSQTGLDRESDQPPARRCARPISPPRQQAQRFVIVQPSYARRRYV